jgi:glucose/mannose-6-phosphate isomerase
MTLDDIRQHDPQGMFGLIRDFPRQVEEAVAIGTAAPLPVVRRGLRQIVLTGLGGSAISGDLLRTLLAGELTVPMTVNRHYVLPASAGTHSLVIVSSYSGNTEETVAAYRDAIRKHATILCISSGGEVARRARRRGDTLISIPGGLSPRAALGYTFFPLLIGLSRLGFIASKRAAIRETIALLRRQSARFSDPGNPENAPLAVARRLHGRLPIIYGSADLSEAVVVRWRGQICENAKQIAFGHVIPEMNHNELVGWSELKDVLGRSCVILLRDAAMHPRLALRMDLTRQIVGRLAGDVVEVWSEGKSPLARMFSLVYFADWVSLYLAILNNQDPTPVAVIDQLKHALAEA